MANLSKLSSIGGIAVAGAALGLYLGSSAISEINPAYYSTPSASSFHADLIPNPGDRHSAPPLPELAQVAEGLGASCVTCGLAPDEYSVVDYGSDESHGTFRSVAPEVVLAQADEYVSRGLSLRDVREIERYAHFPIADDDRGPALADKPERDSDADSAPAEPEEEDAPAI